MDMRKKNREKDAKTMQQKVETEKKQRKLTSCITQVDMLRKNKMMNSFAQGQIAEGFKIETETSFRAIDITMKTGYGDDPRVKELFGRLLDKSLAGIPKLPSSPPKGTTEIISLLESGSDEDSTSVSSCSNNKTNSNIETNFSGSTINSEKQVADSLNEKEGQSNMVTPSRKKSDGFPFLEKSSDEDSFDNVLSRRKDIPCRQPSQSSQESSGINILSQAAKNIEDNNSDYCGSSSSSSSEEPKKPSRRITRQRQTPTKNNNKNNRKRKRR